MPRILSWQGPCGSSGPAKFHYISVKAMSVLSNCFKRAIYIKLLKN